MNTNDNSLILLLRVSSQPAGLWRSLHGNVYTLPFTVVEPSRPSIDPLGNIRTTEKSTSRQVRFPFH